VTALAALDQVSVHFPQSAGLFRAPRLLRAVERVSLTIEPGETLALVGESGSGKTTLGHVAAGLRKPSAGAIRRAPDAGRPQIVFQDPFGALDPRMTVASLVGEPLRIAGTGTPAERRARAADLLRRVGLGAEALDRYPHAFSGGQRQRIAIARALAPEPKLIIADEPLSALDVSVGSQVLNLLRDLQEEHGLAYLFISHDLAVVRHLADRVAVLYLGRLVELGPTDLVLGQPSHPYTAALLDAVPRIGRRRSRRGRALRGDIPSALDPPPGCAFHPRCPKAEPICRIEPPELLPAPGRPTQLAACHFRA